jgi:hypothetical protein
MEDDVKYILYKFDAVVDKQASSHPEVKQDISIYRKLRLWPGEEYNLIGNSTYMEYHLVGTEMEAKRAGCIALMLQKLGNQHHCLALKEAFAFEGFLDILEEPERDWLSSFPDNTLIGPAYHVDGVVVRSTFAVWQPVCKTENAEKEVSLAR